MRILVLDHYGGDGMLDYVLRCQQAGHQVKWHFRKTDRTKYFGKGLATIVDDWREWMRWADLVVLADNTHYLKEVDGWRKEGIKVIGATQESAAWEIQRKTGMEVFKKAGIDLPVYKEFTDYDAAIKFVEKEGRGFVSKPCYDEADKNLTYLGKTPESLIYMLQRWKKEQRLKGPFLLQELIQGTEMAVGGWFGPGGFSQGWCINFEEKKMMVGGLGPSTGEMGTVVQYVKKDKLADKMLKPLEEALEKTGHVGYVDVNCLIDEKGKPWPLEFTCYDDQTDVLTATGWKRFKDVAIGEDVATLDPSTGKAEYRPARDIIAKPYDGELIEFSGGRTFNLCVTPDHAMWVRRHDKEEFTFETAEKVARGNGWYVARTAVFDAPPVPEFTLPAYTEVHATGRHRGQFDLVHAVKNIPMDSWLKFLGLYISEGSLGKRGYITNIAQGAEKKERVRAALSGLPFDVQETQNGFQICSIQLGVWLKAHVPGLCNVKRIPREFMGLNPQQSEILLTALMLGDGSTHQRTGHRTYTTTSSGLADDVQELITRCGNMGRIKHRATKGSSMSVRGGKTYVRNHDTYLVYERTERKFAWLDSRQTTRKAYSGTVYCLNVPPHHLLYVRRNGNPAWCGNCRNGYPTWNIQQELHDGDPAEWLVDLAGGTDARNLRIDTVAVGVVLAHGDFPHSKLKIDDVLGYPIYGADQDCVHLAQAMAGTAPHDLDGKIVDAPCLVTAGDYVLIACGVADTIGTARRRAYKVLDGIKIPNGPFFRTDIGQRLKKELEGLHAHGYAVGLEF